MRALFILWMAAGTASAEVVDASGHGFTSRHEVRYEGSAEAAFDAVVDVAAWWHPDHTYTGDADNLSLEAEAGGCFCEELPENGSVQHMEVVYVEPGKMLRLRGGLGPLQGLGVDGAMTFTFEASEAAASITMTYTVGGYHPDGLNTLAPIVDGVLAMQMERLGAHGKKP